MPSLLMPRMSLGFILKKRYYYGRGLREYKEKHPGALNEQAGAAVKAYVRHWRKLAADPSHTVGVVFMILDLLGAGRLRVSRTV